MATDDPGKLMFFKVGGDLNKVVFEGLDNVYGVIGFL